MKINNKFLAMIIILLIAISNFSIALSGNLSNLDTYENDDLDKTIDSISRNSNYEATVWRHSLRNNDLIKAFLEDTSDINYRLAYARLINELTEDSYLIEALVADEIATLYSGTVIRVLDAFIIDTPNFILLFGHGSDDPTDYTIGGISPAFLNNNPKTVILGACNSNYANIDGDIISFEGNVSIKNIIESIFKHFSTNENKYNINFLLSDNLIKKSTMPSLTGIDLEVSSAIIWIKNLKLIKMTMAINYLNQLLHQNKVETIMIFEGVSFIALFLNDIVATLSEFDPIITQLLEEMGYISVILGIATLLVGILPVVFLEQGHNVKGAMPFGADHINPKTEIDVKIGTLNNFELAKLINMNAEAIYPTLDVDIFGNSYYKLNVIQKVKCVSNADRHVYINIIYGPRKNSLFLGRANTIATVKDAGSCKPRNEAITLTSAIRHWTRDNNPIFLGLSVAPFLHQLPGSIPMPTPVPVPAEVPQTGLSTTQTDEAQSLIIVKILALSAIFPALTKILEIVLAVDSWILSLVTSLYSNVEQASLTAVYATYILIWAAIIIATLYIAFQILQAFFMALTQLAGHMAAFISSIGISKFFVATSSAIGYAAGAGASIANPPGDTVISFNTVAEYNLIVQNQDIYTADELNPLLYPDYIDPMKVDQDNDKLPDDYEYEWWGLKGQEMGYAESEAYTWLVGDNDDDGDGLFNYEEFSLQSNPFASDTDGDTLDDGEEIFGSELITDFSKYRSGELIYEDQIDLISSPTSIDTDGDELGDVMEKAWGTSSTNSDTDGDGMVDTWEIYTSEILGWKPVKYCPDAEYGCAPEDPRITYVGLDPTIHFDSYRHEGLLAGNDWDGDGLNNSMESYYSSDPTSVDSDGDGIGDYFEVFPYTEEFDNDDDLPANILELIHPDLIPYYTQFGYLHHTSPSLADTDGDGYTDIEEYNFFITPMEFQFTPISDIDEDGISDANEFIAGTDPSIDEQPPSVSITSHSNGQFVSGSETIVYSAYDAYAMPQVFLYIDGNIVIPFTTTWETGTIADGSHTLQMVAVDNNGLMTYGDIVTVIVDNTAPTLTAQSHYNGDWVSGTVTISFTVIDGETGIDPATIELIINGESFQQTSREWITAAYEDGNYGIEFTARDFAGNEVHRLYLIEVDNSVPVITGHSPGENQVVTGSVMISFTATGATAYQIRVDGQIKEYASSYYWQTAGLSEGYHTIELLAIDYNYPNAVHEIIVRVNNYAPVVTASATYDNSIGIWASGNMYVSATASDGNGISSVLFWVDGSIVCIDNTSPYSCTVNLNSWSDGLHTVDVFAIDGAGTSSTTITFYINSDKTAPTGYVYLYGSPTNYVGGIYRDFYTTSADAGVGIAYVDFYVDGSYLRTDDVGSYYRYYDLNTFAYGDGVHNIRADIYDHLGNMRSSDVDFVIDNDNPWASISGITNGAYYTRYTTVTVSVTAHDTGTGVNRIEIYVNGYMYKQSYSTSTSYQFVMPSSGSRTVLVKVYDDAGHMRSYTYTLYVSSGGGGGGGGPPIPIP